MTNSSIIGRKREIDILKDIYKSNRPEFVAIYGRRRIGKT
jgi:AAA+ ATPase superfamily predicted ATPase